jgi:hypothetical protein
MAKMTPGAHDLSAKADVPPTPAAQTAKVLLSVRGILKSADIEDYGKHLSTKYR